MKKWLVVLLMALPMASAWASEGGTSSGGTDNYRREDGAAWFLSVSGKKVIQTCFVTDRGFGVSDGTLRAAVESSFKQWREYLDAKNWHEKSFFVTSVVFMDKCDGSEDLRFYFGATDPDVEKARQGHREPFAVTNLSQYDEKTGWGKGFVWIAPPSSISPNVPNWTDPLNLTAILLHEVGHILGCSHATGTIMAVDLSRGLKYEWPDQMRTDYLTKIEHEKELLECTECAGVYNGIPREGAFSVLLGAASDEISAARFIKTGGGRRPRGTLELTGAKGIHTFAVDPRVFVARGLEENVELFKIRYAGYLNGPKNRGGSAYYGTLTLPNGETLPIIFEENMLRAIEISFIPPEGEKAVHLFEAGGRL